jgi:hypothetical protein
MSTRDNQIRSVAKPTPNAWLQKMGPPGELKRVAGEHQRIPDKVMRALPSLTQGSPTLSPTSSRSAGPTTRI